MLQDGSLMAKDPYDLGGVRTLARLSGVQLSENSSYEEIQSKLFPVWGKEKLFRQNAPAVAAALSLEEGGVPDEQIITSLLATETLDRIALRNVFGLGSPAGAAVVIYAGATANGMERSVRESARYVGSAIVSAATYLIASDRVCDEPEEVTNHFVREYRGHTGHYPTEAQLLPRIVKQLTGQKREVGFKHDRQSEQVRQLIKARKEVATGRVYWPTIANKTSVPLHARRVIRELYPDFDSDGSQFWFSQDDIALATTAAEAADPARYQHPLTVFSGLVRLLNELHLLQNPFDADR